MSWHDTNATAAAAWESATELFARHVRALDATGSLWANPVSAGASREPMTSLAFVAKALGYPQPRKEGGQ